MAEDRNLLNQLRDKGQRTIEGLKRQYGLGGPINNWPQTKAPDSELKILYPNWRTRGFLPPESLSPMQQINRVPGLENDDFNNPVKKVFGDYKYFDWRGHLLDLPGGDPVRGSRATVGGPSDSDFSKDSKRRYDFDDETRDRWRGNSINNSGLKSLDGKNRFDRGDVPRIDTEGLGRVLDKNPYSTRDIYAIFSNNTTDYFRHGLHIIDGLTPIENPENGVSELRKSNFKGTPFEKNDPVMFGFELIIDDITSPLLNGSVLDFLRNYSSISEVRSKIPVYEDFKQQFIKFFKTKSTVSIDVEKTSITKMRESGLPESPGSPSRDNFFQDMHKRAYMNYYIKKIAGLEKLVEANTPSQKKYLVDYAKGTDLISLNFSEDVTLSVGTLAHLYKLLYWSKPNGKGIVPENLLRFNCDIIVSEVRNYNRVIKAIENGELEIIKDNVSRYIYSLKECQFYFDKMPHGGDVDMGMNTMALFPEGGYTLNFDYKYSSLKLERFMPIFGTNGGQYVGYDGGAMWRIGRPGERDARKDPSIDTSKFFTVGGNYLNENGVSEIFKIKKLSPVDKEIPQESGTSPNFEDFVFPLPDGRKVRKEGETQPLTGFAAFKKASTDRAKRIANNLVTTAINSTARELQFAVNTRVAILNRTLNRIANSLGITRLGPPRNVYTDRQLRPGQRIFWDVRGQLFNFLGTSLASQTQTSIKTPFPDPRIPSTSNIGDVLDSNSGNLVSQYGTSDFSKIQFPNSGQKFPAPYLDTSSISNKLDASVPIVPNSPSSQRFGQLVSDYGTNTFTNIQFPNSAQKFPSPLDLRPVVFNYAQPLKQGEFRII
jgi:hypothetical protein